MFKVNYRNTRTRREICSKLTTKTPERLHWLNGSDWEKKKERTFLFFFT